MFRLGLCLTKISWATQGTTANLYIYRFGKLTIRFGDRTIKSVRDFEIKFGDGKVFFYPNTW